MRVSAFGHPEREKRGGRDRQFSLIRFGYDDHTPSGCNEISSFDFQTAAGKLRLTAMNVLLEVLRLKMGRMHILILMYYNSTDFQLGFAPEQQKSMTLG